jgi:hypothetical protein
VKRYTQRTGINPLEEVQSPLAAAWGDAQQIKSIYWPLTIRLWRKQT